MIFRSFLSALLLSAALSPAFAEPAAKSVRYAEELSLAFENVAEKITPSLVNIRAEARPSQNGPAVPPGLPEPFKDFFEQFRGTPFNAPQPSGLGSGVIVDQKGHILTNDHVVSGSEKLTVRLHDGRSFSAELVGTDPRTDLAVVKIDAENLSPASLGNSDDLKIGEWVVAAGTPFGLENTITAGVVSAKGRSSIIGGNAYEDFIQTDAAINPGNSGGPLANLRGEVVGINTAIFSRSGGYMGIGFAIPINMAKSVYESLVREGRVVRGWLGVAIQDLTAELADSFGHEGTNGALIGDVSPDSPAAQAGLKQGDIITRFDGQEIEGVNQLRNQVARTRPQSRVEVEVFREEKRISYRVTLGELPSGTGGVAPSEPDPTRAETGLAIETLTPELAQQLNTELQHGVVVRSVVPGSLAALAGLQPKDIIHRVGKTKIQDVKDFEEALSKDALKKGVRLVVQNDGFDRFVILRSKG